MKIDLSVQIKRLVESQSYQLNLLVINETNTGKLETYMCQTLAEVCECIAKFEAENLELFQNAIDYEHTDWRQLARQNQAARKGLSK